MSSATKIVISALVLIALVNCQANWQGPFNGQASFNNLDNNPGFMNQILNGNQFAGPVAPQCKEIPGVGFPILAIKKFLIAVDLHLDKDNINTFVKIIFFTETKTTTGLNVKLIVLFKTFTEQFYAGIEGELRLRGTQRFRLLNYHYDTDIEAVKQVLGETNVDVNNFIGCGNLKEIYTNFLRNNKRPDYLTQNIPYGQTALPLTPPTFNNQPPTFGWANGNAPNGSRQNAGPFLYNFGG